MIGRLFVVSAPSGAGKTTLVNAAIADLQDIASFNRVITYTTRLPRAGEIHGVDYHFITHEEFQAKITQNYFIEWSSAYKTFYGSPIHIIEELKKGANFIAIVDFKGAESIKEIYSEACTIWISPPSIGVLAERLLKRGLNTKKDLEFRLSLAQAEMKREGQMKFFDYQIINDDFLTAKELLKKLLLSN